MSQLITKIPHWSENFSEAQKTMLDEHYSIISNTRDMDYFIEYLENRHRWRYPMVSIDTFLDDPRYLGSSLLMEKDGTVRSNIYPKVRSTVKEILEGGYTEAVIVEGIGCVAGETKVFNPITGKFQRIDSLEKSFVYAKKGKKLVVTKATRPKQYKREKLFKVITERGQAIIVTKKHKFYEISGQWKTLSSLDSSSSLLVSGGDHLLTILEFCLSVLYVGGQRFLQRGVNFLKHCWRGFRQYGLRPQSVKATSLNASPLQDDVLLHSHYRLQKDGPYGEVRDNPICLQYSPHAKQDYLSHYKSGEVDEEFCIFHKDIVSQQVTCLLWLRLLLSNVLKRGFLFYSKFRCWFWLAYTNHTLRYEKIKSITFEREDIYYDLHVPKLNNYLANGFINHNSGKTLTSNLLSCYMTHKLLCYRDPHKEFNLVKDKPITLMNMGTTATQAIEVAFSGIKAYMQVSPWFQRFSPHILGGSVRFIENNILIVAGNSKSTTPLGYNIFNATLDEAAFYLDNDNKQLAEDIYMALQRRITSRFPGKGLLVMISSPLYEGDFVMRQLEMAKKMPELIYSAQLPTWKVKPITDEIRKNTFYFNARKSVILDTLPTTFGSICKLDDDFDSKKEIWEIPTDYKKSFLQDPDKAKRDFAAVPSKAVQAFMPHWEIIEKMFTDEESPLQANGSYIFPDAPLRCNYYIHIDLALNKEGSGDFAGLAMCHFGGWEENSVTKERHKTVVVDLAERIGAGSTGEIAFSDVRNKIYALKAMGYNIKLVTLDSYGSQDTFQLLRGKGIRSELLSVDRTIEPYQTLKEMIYSERIKCHKMPELLEEFSRLEITKANKIDHAPGSKKDISDSVAGCTFSCVQDTGGEVGIVSTSYFPPETGKPVTGEKSDREKYYERLQELNKKGLLT